MRKLILFVLVFVSFKASAQWTIINGKQRFAQGLGIPVKDTGVTLLNDSAQIVLRPQDSAIYYKYKGKWQKTSGGGSGTTPSLQQVTNVDSTTNRVVSVRELNLLDVDGSGSYDLNLKGYNMGLAITDKNAEQILKINGTGVGTPKLYFGEAGTSATLIPTGNNPQLNLPSINGTLALISDITYPDTTVIATHTYVDSSTKTKIDSLKRSTDSVFALKNGSWVFQYKDTLRYDTATVVLAYVSNADTGTLQRGEVVYLFGATGDRASVKRANNKTDTTSSKTFAIVRDPITQGNAGYVVTQGQCGKLNLSAYNEGDILWLDSIAGQMTKNKPQAPYHQVFVGVVERANAGNGLFYVKPANGFELGELHNVQVNSQNNNDVLYYDSVPKLWKAKSPYLLVDTSKLSTRIDARVKYTDTATMLTPYLRKIDTASLSNRINTKLNISDTTVFDRKNISSYSFNANNTNASANVTSQAFRDSSYTLSAGEITWSGGTAPAGTKDETIRWVQVGKMVTVYITLYYATAGTANTSVAVTFPSALPAPFIPSGMSAASRIISFGLATFITNYQTATANYRGGLRRNSANTGNEFFASVFSGSVNAAWTQIIVTYFVQ